MSSSHRLKILSEQDVTSFYEIPNFNNEEKKYYFYLPDEVIKTLKIKDKNTNRTASILYFILQYGYFKAKHQFFSFETPKVTSDIEYIMSHYMPNDIYPEKICSRDKQREAKKSILSFYSYTDDSNLIKKSVVLKLKELVKRINLPIELFDEVIKYCNEKRFVILGYQVLQDLIGNAIKNEEKRLQLLLVNEASNEIKAQLDELLKKDPETYLITTLQCDAQTFQLEQMKKEREKITFCRDIYKFAVKVLVKSGVSNKMVHYYGDLTRIYKADRMKRISPELARFYLLCYVRNRYEIIMNNLVQAFIYHVDKQQEYAKNYVAKKMPALKGPLDSYQSELGKLISIFTKEKIMAQDGESIQKKAFNILPEETIIALSNRLLEGEKSYTKQKQEVFFQFYKEKGQYVSINLRPLFLIIDFEICDELKPLMRACKFWERALLKGQRFSQYYPSQIPMDHIKPKSLHTLFKSTIKTKSGNKTIINPHQYEFYLYRALREKIRTRKVTIDTSTGYRSFAREINIPKNWRKLSKEMLANINNKNLIKPIDELLSEFEKMLEPLYERVNYRILNEENQYVKITRKRDGTLQWSLPYPSKDNPEFDNPFYKNLEVKTISEVFDFVSQECPFMDVFRHVKSYCGSNEQDHLAIKGVILANGTMQGINLFARRSNLKYKRLKVAEDNYIFLENLRSAADIIMNQMFDLPIFELYLIDNQLHGSIDGKKKKSKRKLLRARYSSKYFGTDVGLVLMTMAVGHIPVATNIIGANEHESHYTFPLLIQNNDVIDPDIISTDTEGANNINDLLYYLTGKIHAPHYRNFSRHEHKLRGFKPMAQYSDYIIKPEKQLNKKLIKKKWPEIVPILYSLLSNDSKQENIIKFLSSHDYKSDIKEAIWELNRLPKSIHYLRYIDTPDYRRAVRTSLNRGEAYHQLLDNIANVGGGKFRGKSDLEVELWNECMRFIALLIIYYNMSLLSKLLGANKDNEAAINYLKTISPVASQHLNINGLYEFSEEANDIDIDSMVNEMEKLLAEALQKKSD